MPLAASDVCCEERYQIMKQGSEIVGGHSAFIFGPGKASMTFANAQNKAATSAIERSMR